MAHTLDRYRLDYTIWAAYRAAQAGSSKAKGSEFTFALKACGVIEYIDRYKNEKISQNEFDSLHRDWCDSIINTLKNDFSKNIEYGIAAKLIGVFLKGYFILANNEKQPLSVVIHPPIDSFLLKGIDSKNNTNYFNAYRWQKLSKPQYFELFTAIKSHLKDGEPLWFLEEFWILN